MARQKNRQNRCPASGGMGQPQVNRYRHPIAAGAPCGFELQQIRKALARQEELLAEILTLLRGREGE